MIALVFASVLATLELPAYDSHIVDNAGLLDEESRARLEHKLRAYERDSGPQLAVLLVPESGDMSVEEYASRVFEAWHLGRAGKDDGLLLVVVTRARVMRIEVGDGLEGSVTDVLASRIIRTTLTPAFREQRYATGIDQALDALTQAISGTVVASGVSDASGAGSVVIQTVDPPAESELDWWAIVATIMTVVLMFTPATLVHFRKKPARARRKAGLPLSALDRWVLKPTSSRGGSSRSSWSSSSRGSSSSSSGFSGGGGGRSSGGGASGSW